MKKKILIIIVILMFIGGIFLIIINPIVSLKNEIKVSLNSKVKSEDYFNYLYLGTVQDTSFDTTKLGNFKVMIEVKNIFGSIKKYQTNLKVVDDIKPVITGDTVITTYQNINVDLLKDVSVTDNYDNDLKVEIEGEYDISKVGEYKLKYVTYDSSSNSTSLDFTLKVLEAPKVEFSNNQKKTSKGYVIENRNGVTYINDILIANKTYSLPKTYGNGLTSDTSSAFSKMQKDAKSAGLNIWIKSGFRSYQDQVAVYNGWVKKDGKSKADTYSARAGHSEHQSGLAMDLNSLSQSFENTKEFKWLNENAYKYGFILRYPKSKEGLTGYIYEPWHYRYVGVDIAKTLYNNGDWITLEEYLGIDSKYS